MKYEGKENFIAEFVGLAAKMYSLLFVGPDGELTHEGKGKGVPKRVLKRHAGHEEFKRMLFQPYKSSATFRRLQSSAHVVRQLMCTKKMLTPINRKVFQESSTFSRPLGHHANKLPWVVHTP